MKQDVRFVRLFQQGVVTCLEWNGNMDPGNTASRKVNRLTTADTERAVVEDSGVEIRGRALTVTDVMAVASGAPVVLSASGRRHAAASAAFAIAAAQQRPLYGRSTGVGANRLVPVATSFAAGRDHTMALVRSHATSAGGMRSPERVRATLVVRLNQLCAGGSGIDPVIVDGLAEMIAADALPLIRELGSIGTADLSALATVALALAGEGRVRRSDGTVGLSPFSVPFGPGDGLGFCSSNAATLADACLAIDRIELIVRAVLTVAALSFVAVDGNIEAFSPAVGRATPFAGAVRVCAEMRRLTGHDLAATSSLSSPARIQDPFGLRTLPQVLGPVLDAVTACRAVVEKLINAPSENPVLLPSRLITEGAGVTEGTGVAGGTGVAEGTESIEGIKFAEGTEVAEGAEIAEGTESSESTSSAEETTTAGTVAHHGGFHQAYLQMALDTLNLAIAQSGQLGLGRLSMLLEPSFTGLHPFLSDGIAGSSGLMVCEYVAASALGEIRDLANPAGLQTASISRGVEEDASFASLAARKTLAIAERWPSLLATELVAAIRALRQRGLSFSASEPIGRALEICARLPGDTADRDLTEDLLLAEELLPELAAL